MREFTCVRLRTVATAEYNDIIDNNWYFRHIEARSHGARRETIIRRYGKALLIEIAYARSQSCADRPARADIIARLNESMKS